MVLGGDFVNWEKFFGVSIYGKLKAFCEARNMSLASAIRSAVASYISKQEG